MPTVAERVADAVAPVLDERGLLLHDLEHSGTSIRVVIDRADVEDGRGLDVDALAAATRAISRLLDELDPIDGHYTLEVSSPGLERPLRTPAHFARAVGADVSVKTRPGSDGERRVEGTVQSADDDGFTLTLADGGTRRIRYDEVEKARTTFAWGPAPKPGGPKPPKAAKSAKAAKAGAAAKAAPTSKTRKA
jgi:ribosome maturation factor RimP